MKRLTWLPIVLLLLVIFNLYQHFDSSRKTNLLLKSSATSSPFEAPVAFTEGKPPTLTWDNLRGLDYKTGKAAQSIGKLDGKTVSIPGFAVPIDGESEEKITEFLLVPEPMMCIHVPPPPPNQLIHVRLKTPGPVESLTPILLSGRLKIVKTKSDYGKAGYEMEGIRVVPFTQQ